MLNQEEIKKQAKKIIDDFASSLEGIKTEDVFVERQEDRREEQQAEKPNEDFRKRMLKNAPKKDDDCVVAEKGSWT
jgi:aspartyl-tRNA(Asn)/glutamyl-tRNA(Gln) amidotransferase subunit C